jgi:tetratricopeptide (TPR) repeat protein
LGQYSAAIRDFDKAIQLEPDDAEAYNNRGVAKKKLRQYLAAIRDYNKALQLKPDHAEAYINRGNAKLDLEQYTAAINDYDKAIQLRLYNLNQILPRHISTVGLRRVY